jgi:outer membrane protein assembly factor BamB
MFCLTARCEEWPQWRGLNREGKWTEDNLVRTFDSNEIPSLWEMSISSGYSGPSVSQGRVFVPDRWGKFERVHCFGAERGEKIWDYSYKCIYSGIAYPAGPRSVVTVDEQRAYFLGAMGHLSCLDVKTGKVIWKKDLDSIYDMKIPTWGISGSPLIYKDFVIVTIGGKDGASVVGFNKLNGKEIWRSLNDEINYSSSILIKQNGKDVAVVWTNQAVNGINPFTGDVYWRAGFETTVGIATPVKAGDKLFVSEFWKGSMMIKLNEDEVSAKKLWQVGGKNERDTRALHCCISTPVIIGNYIYGVDSYGEFRCLKSSDGERVWTSLEPVPKARWANVHMVKNDEIIWMFNERGELIITKLSLSGYDELSRAKVIEPTKEQFSGRGGVCWSHPAYAYKKIYIRNDEKILCADLEEK